MKQPPADGAEEDIVVVHRRHEDREESDELLRARAFAQDEDGHTWLHLAVIYECEEDVDKLLRLDTDGSHINQADHSHQTPLHLAILVKNPRIVRKLIRAGADATVLDLHGNTPLHIACELRFHDGIRALLRPLSQEETTSAPAVPSESVLHRRNRRGFYAIHIACFVNDKEAIALLTQYGADVNAKDTTNGQTMSHSAVEENNLEMLQFLVDECNANLQLTNAFDQTPLDMAESLDQREMAAWLESRLKQRHAPEQDAESGQ